ncbi:hypothetical protein LPJ64_001899 [Coemansia asiatica]|uniref:Conserved oligomeric Golgi complex subunit 2 n=1 Tax=Coemansia asiatica TaxID=1052880 RepID=A0A9W7XKH5_9FUNG|nr:hypothetical protein LPJ64_001899 [Coemansia asiatica]KAJ2878480.1 hypothetical protein FB639_003376 [Coemansia asiatica]
MKELSSMQSAFDIHDYAQTRFAQGKTLPELHLELSTKHQALRAELQQLIAARYEDFLGLSTSLTGIDVTLKGANKQLSLVGQQIDTVYEELLDKKTKVDQQLLYRSEVREKRAILRLFLDISQLLDRANGVLKEINNTEVDALERAAADYAQIKYFVTKAGDYAEHLFLMKTMDRIKDTEKLLMAELEKSLVQCITEYLKQPTASRATAVSQCIRAYGTADAYEQAEELLAGHLAKPRVTEIVGVHAGKGMGMDPSVFYKMLHQTLEFVSLVGRSLAAAMESDGLAMMAARVFWKEVSGCIMTLLPLVFVPGTPDSFHKNYCASVHFTRCFAQLFGISSDDAMFSEFGRKWQLAAYFSVRRREIVDIVEGRTKNSTADSGYIERAISGINQCWDPSVVLAPLAAKFWQLTLQIIQWTRRAMVIEYNAKINETANANANAGSAIPAIRMLQDTRLLNNKLSAEILPKVLDQVANGIARDDVKETLQAALTHVLHPLQTDSEAALAQAGASIVASSCLQLTSHLRRTTSQYRHTGRDAPLTASAYIKSLLSSLNEAEKITDQMQGQDASMETKIRLREIVCQGISKELAKAMLDALATISKTEASLLRLRGERRKASVSAEDTPIPAGTDLRGKVPESDNDKIRRQIWLDVTEMANLISRLGVQPHPEFLDLIQTIAPLGI